MKNAEAFAYSFGTSFLFYTSLLVFFMETAFCGYDPMSDYLYSPTENPYWGDVKAKYDLLSKAVDKLPFGEPDPILFYKPKDKPDNPYQRSNAGKFDSGYLGGSNGGASWSSMGANHGGSAWGSKDKGYGAASWASTGGKSKKLRHRPFFPDLPDRVYVIYGSPADYGVLGIGSAYGRYGIMPSEPVRKRHPVTKTGTFGRFPLGEAYSGRK